MSEKVNFPAILKEYEIWFRCSYHIPHVTIGGRTYHLHKAFFVQKS